MHKPLILFLASLLSVSSFAGSMNCRVSEMIDYGMWAGFPKGQVDLDTNIASIIGGELGHSIKIDLKKITESQKSTTLILKSSVGSEKIELVITPVVNSLDKFQIHLTQLSSRATVIASKEITVSSKTVNVARIAVDGNGKTTMMECDVGPL